MKDIEISYTSNSKNFTNFYAQESSMQIHSTWIYTKQKQSRKNFYIQARK